MGHENKKDFCLGNRKAWREELNLTPFLMRGGNSLKENFDARYQTRETVFHRDAQTPRRELKMRRAEYF